MVITNKLARTSVKLALVVVMAIYPCLGTLRTAAAAPASGAMQSVFAKTGTLNGVVTGSSGKPMAKIALSVVDSSGKKVATAITDKAGKFTLPNLKPGQYRLLVGKDVQLKLTVSGKGTTSNLKIVLPTDGKSLLPGLMQGPAGGLNWTFIAIAGFPAALAMSLTYMM